MSKDAITFNEESLEDLRKTFRLFDVDNDGKVNHHPNKQQTNDNNSLKQRVFLDYCR